MKKFISAVLCILLVVSLCGCENKDISGAREAVTNFMDAVIAGDLDVVKQYAGSIEIAKNVFPDNQNIKDITHASQIKMSTACRDKITYEIGKVSFKGDGTAQVEVEITAPNISALFKSQVVDITKGNLRKAYETISTKIKSGSVPLKKVTYICPVAKDGEQWNIDYSFEESVYGLMSVKSLVF